MQRGSRKPAALLGLVLSFYRITPLLAGTLILFLIQLLLLALQLVWLQLIDANQFALTAALVLVFGVAFTMAILTQFDNMIASGSLTRFLVDTIMLSLAASILHPLLLIPVKALLPDVEVRKGVVHWVWALLIPPLVARTIEHLALRTSQSFSILLLRPFSQGHSRKAKLHIGPILGAYGHLRTISNAEYEKPTARDFMGVSQENFARPLGAPILGDNEWHDSVIDLLEEADVVVIDISQHSLNLEWEMANALRRLGPERVIFICDQGQAASRWRDLIDEYDLEAGTQLGSIESPISTGLLFRFLIFWRMLTLRERQPQLKQA